VGRRALLRTLGVGLAGTGGCLRLQSGEDGGETATATGESDDATTAAAGTRTTDTPPAEPGRYVLSERWRAEFGVDYVRAAGGHFYLNDFGRVAEAVPGDGVLWTDEVTFEGSTANLGADAIGRGDDTVVFGFFSEPAAVDEPGAYFVAHEEVTGERRWTVGVPAAADNDYTNLPRGVAVVDGVAVLGIEAGGRFRLRGVDVRTGEGRWTAAGRGGINGVEAHDGAVYVNRFAGVTVRDPTTGSVTERHEGWRGANSRIRAGSFVAGSDGVRAYPLAEGAADWSVADVSGVTTLAADNSLVVAGTETGAVHALERATGERRWDATIDGTVWQIELGSRSVWVADRETGLTAYDRRDGRAVHRSTQPIERAGIAVAGGSILLGNETARLYDVEPA
jgi:outer membrane protein assembly factor BamB